MKKDDVTTAEGGRSSKVELSPLVAEKSREEEQEVKQGVLAAKEQVL